MARKFRILLLCGTGIATSTAMNAKIQDVLREQGLAASVELRQGKIADVLRGSVDADLVVATAQVPSTVKVPIINGVPLLTGIGAETVLDQIVAAVRQGVE
jgi:PTS system galactitol-specific IIB component